MLSKIIINETSVKEYVTIATTDDRIRERVYLQFGDRSIDISGCHWPLSLDPVTFGIWISRKENIAGLNSPTVCKMYFTDSATDIENPDTHLISVLTLEFADKIEEEDGIFLLLKPVKASIRHLAFPKIIFLFLKHYKKPGLSFSKFKYLVSVFSYPRKVRLVSFGREKHDYNIFPMDFTGDIVSSGRFVFGLRHTNRSVSNIIESKKLVVSECSSVYKPLIYELGKHHLAHPPSFDALPFKISDTAEFGFYIPEWVDSYKEIRIEKTMNLGSHMLFWGKSVNETNLRVTDAHLYHIHFLLYLHQKRRHFSYSPA